MYKEKEVFIKWFKEIDKNSGKISGGKGANLAEIYNLGIPVPPGFVITTDSYKFFINQNNLCEKIKKLLEKIDYEKTDELNNISKEIRTLIEKTNFPEKLKEEIIDAYETLDEEENEINISKADEIINKETKHSFVAIRSSATTEDLPGASFAGQQDTFLNIKGNEELLKNVKKCFSSLFTPRAMYYRNKKGFKEEAYLAVIVQKMIDSDSSGVIFSKDPSLNKNNIIIEAVWGLGEGIVSGEITPDRYIVSKDENIKIKEKKINEKLIAITKDGEGNKKKIKLKQEISKKQVVKDYEIIKLSEIALKIEEHYKTPQDIEFAIEKEKIYIVQTRPITTIKENFSEKEIKELKGEIILEGLAASPGISYGKVKIIKSLDELNKVNQGDILVTKMTNPDMVVTMQKCSAIVTDEGGLTAHASIVSREMGIPAIVGTRNATNKLKEGEIITVDGFFGKIYQGKVSETIKKEILPVENQTKTEIKLIVDLPKFAEEASKTKLKKIGLTRIEGIIAESGKHPNYFLKNKNMEEYEKIIFEGLEKITEFFQEIWVRTSDIRSDEFHELKGAPEKIETNPMLGMHGIRYSLKNKEILISELKAMKKISEKNKKVGILTPQIISVDELKQLKKIIKELNFNQIDIGIMIETPASVQIIEELCEEGIDFISIGTNDLTQYTLAIDRGNEKVQELYDEMHPAILKQIKKVFEICKKNKVVTSVCGQAGGKKEMVEFLIKNKIDSISVNADLASEISIFITELEKNLLNETENNIPNNEKNYNIGENDFEEEKIKEKQENKIEENYEKNIKLNQEKEFFPKIKGAIEKEGDDENKENFNLDIF